MKQNIGLRIKAIRQANKITQEILAESVIFQQKQYQT